MAANNIGRWSVQAQVDASGMTSGVNKAVQESNRFQNGVSGQFRTAQANISKSMASIREDSKNSLGSLAGTVGTAWTAAAGSIVFRMINFSFAQMKTSTDRLFKDVEAGTATAEIRELVAELTVARQATVGVRTEWDRFWGDANLGIERIISSWQHFGELSAEQQMMLVNNPLAGAGIPVGSATVQTSIADLAVGQRLKEITEVVAFLKGNSAFGSAAGALQASIIPASDTAATAAGRSQYLQTLAREAAMLDLSAEARRRLTFEMQGATQEELHQFDVLSAAMQARAEGLERERVALEQGNRAMADVRNAVNQARTPFQMFQDAMRNIPGGLNRAQRGSLIEQAMRQAGFRAGGDSPLLGSLSASGSDTMEILQASMTRRTEEADTMNDIREFLREIKDQHRESMDRWGQIADNTAELAELWEQ